MQKLTTKIVLLSLATITTFSAQTFAQDLNKTVKWAGSIGCSLIAVGCFYNLLKPTEQDDEDSDLTLAQKCAHLVLADKTLELSIDPHASREQKKESFIRAVDRSYEELTSVPSCTNTS